MNIRVFVLYWDKSPPLVPAINGFPQRAKNAAWILTSCRCREWTLRRGHLPHLGSIFRYLDKVRFEFESSSVWCDVCGDVQLWNKEVHERRRGCIIYCISKEILSKERRRKMLSRIMRHNHWERALISYKRTIVNNLHNDGMKSMLNVHKGLCARNKRHPQCHTEGLNWNSLDRSHCYTETICGGKAQEASVSGQFSSRTTSFNQEDMLLVSE